jgi:hypothetical protein
VTLQTTIATTLTLEDNLAGNVYYWRVRAVSLDGDQGVWNVGPAFDTAFAAAVTPYMSDVDAPNLGAGTAADSGTQGYQTEAPIVKWDPVPGASAYQVRMMPYDETGEFCDPAAPSMDIWTSRTASTAWTPLGFTTVAKPVAGGDAYLVDLPQMRAGQSYCVGVTPLRADDVAGVDVAGNEVFVTGPNQPAFEFTGYPAGDACEPSCTNHYLGTGDYRLPVTGSTTAANPVFTWEPLAGKGGYFVVVARDAALTNIIDYAFTNVPAYAPRAAMGPRTYSDEYGATRYYWGVFPTNGTDGSGAAANMPSLAAVRNFHKESDAPTLALPADDPTGADPFDAPPTLSWSNVTGAMNYTVQVATDATFDGSIVDEATVTGTSYTSDANSYPTGQSLYWRVRANGDNGGNFIQPAVGLKWSATHEFRVVLPAPMPDAGNPTGGENIPVWEWAHVPGAVSYDIRWEETDGDIKDTTLSPIRARSFTFVEWTGLGTAHWQVRANFPKGDGTYVHSPYSTRQAYTRTMAAPTGARSSTSGGVLLQWDPKIGAKTYKVQISTKKDFSTLVEEKTTDLTSYAPSLMLFGMEQADYAKGGTFYWRVRGVDADQNEGVATDPAGGPLHFSLPMQLMLTQSGFAQKGFRSTITITVKNPKGGNVAGATVTLKGGGYSVKKKTGTGGKVSFVVKPTRRGTMTITATKSGFKTAVLTQTIY